MLESVQNWTDLAARIAAAPDSSTNFTLSRPFICNYDKMISIIGKQIRIVGSGAVLDAEQYGRFFELTDSATLTLLGPMTFKNGRVLSDGGAIKLGPTTKLKAEAVTFIKNEASPYLGAGGGIHAISAKLELYSCVFQNNQAKYGGAVRASSCDMILKRNVYDSNRARLGGALL